MNAQIQYRRGTDPKSEDERVAMSKEAFKHDFLDNLFCVQGKIPALATRHDYYMALAYTVRDRMLHRWISTAEAYTNHGSRTDGSPSRALTLASERRRAGPRQRRPGTAGGLFSRFDGQPGNPLDRLRDPLRVRHLPTGDCRW